jgi:hypothetical protein
MTDILSAIHAGGKDNICEVKASARALVFSIIGRGKSTHARATLQADLFEEYIFESSSDGGANTNISSRCSNSRSGPRMGGTAGGGESESVMHFSINLTTLLDCLLLFGTSSESTAATITFSVG